MSHSKRNTSLAFFTSHERSLLKTSWGSQSKQLTRDSFIPFGSCMLCLLPCQDPVVCSGGPAPSALRGSPSTAANGTESKKRKRGEEDGKQQCHLFCRECIMSNLLAQRKELKRLEKIGEAERAEERDMDAKDDEDARARAIEEFEQVQQGFEPTSRGARGGRADEMKQTAEVTPVQRRLEDSTAEGPAQSRRGEEKKDEAAEELEDNQEKKRRQPFDLNEEELLRIVKEDRQKALKSLNDEKAANSKSSLPSFWVPSLTPGEKRPSLGMSASGKKQQPICPGSTAETGHALSLKTLIPAKFDEQETQQEHSHASSDASSNRSIPKMKTCPACSRQLTNASKAMLAKPCGHVCCGSCVSRFVLGDEGDVVSSSDFGKKKEPRCFVCSESLAERKGPKGGDAKDSGKEKERIKPGLVEICSEGTGFAGGGKSIVQASGTAFQC